MFTHALKWQLFDGRNPAASPGMLREIHRDRYLTAAETQALVLALDGDPCQDAAAALALLIVTHNTNVAYASDYVFNMQDGRLVE